MVHKDIIERRKEKLKPRGKPFPKGNKRGKIENETLANRGCESGVEGGAVTPIPQSVSAEPLIEDSSVLNLLPSLVMNITDDILKENMTTPAEIGTIGPGITLDSIKVEPMTEAVKDLELIESLDFMNGNNKLSIRFSKKHNRMYRIQVFINDEHEVRPVTYSGATTGVTFWNLLKGVLNK